MHGIQICFEILGPEGFREIGRVTADNALILADGVAPDDLPGNQGARVRSGLERGEITLQPAS